MRARLFSKVGETQGMEFEVADELTIGRHTDNTMSVQLDRISKRHARIFHDTERGCYVLEDLGSLNGTTLDGEPVEGPERLRHLHLVTLAGKYDFIFQDLERCRSRHPGAPQVVSGPSEAPMKAGEGNEVTDIDEMAVEVPSFLQEETGKGSTMDSAGAGEPAGTASEQERTRIDTGAVSMPSFLGSDTKPMTRVDDEPPRVPPPTPESVASSDREVTSYEELPVAMPDALLGSASAEQTRPKVFQLEIPEEDGGTRFVPLKDGANYVGRDAAVEVLLESREVSRRHAVLTVSSGQVWVRDEGSHNHTYLDSEELTDERRVEPGQWLSFGSIEARLVEAGEPSDGGDGESGRSSES